MQWIPRTFEELTPSELYDIMKLRQDVFIIEQECIYPDIDGYDSKALHFLGKSENELAAYARIFKPGLKCEESSIGRIVVHPGFRKQGYGKKLVQNCINYCRNNYTGTGIRIEAQSHLQKFYTDLGFSPEGEIYPVDGIPHVQMVRQN